MTIWLNATRSSLENLLREAHESKSSRETDQREAEIGAGHKWGKKTTDKNVFLPCSMNKSLKQNAYRNHRLLLERFHSTSLASPFLVSLALGSDIEPFPQMLFLPGSATVFSEIPCISFHVLIWITCMFTKLNCLMTDARLSRASLRLSFVSCNFLLASLKRSSTLAESKNE